MSGAVAVFDFQREFVGVFDLSWVNDPHAFDALRHEAFG